MSRDTSFYYSFLVLPPRKRRAIVAVWDFCRAVDDAVDEVAPSMGSEPDAGVSAARDAVASWRRELDAVYDPAGHPSTRQGRALRPFVQEFSLPREEFELLIDGVEMDVGQVCYATFPELCGYCRRVAGTVGLICLQIFGYRDRRSRDYALHLATALQLTNIVRDLAADVRQGRVYLPAEDLSRFGVTVADLQAGRLVGAVRDCLVFQCDRAATYYAQASAALPGQDRRRLVAAEIMGWIYFAILGRIRRSGYDVFSTRIRVPRPERLVIALRVWGRSLVGLPNAFR